MTFIEDAREWRTAVDIDDGIDHDTWPVGLANAFEQIHAECMIGTTNRSVAEEVCEILDLIIDAGTQADAISLFGGLALKPVWNRSPWALANWLAEGNPETRMKKVDEYILSMRDLDMLDMGACLSDALRAVYLSEFVRAGRILIGSLKDVCAK